LHYPLVLWLWEDKRLGLSFFLQNSKYAKQQHLISCNMFIPQIVGSNLTLHIVIWPSVHIVNNKILTKYLILANCIRMFVLFWKISDIIIWEQRKIILKLFYEVLLARLQDFLDVFPQIMSYLGNGVINRIRCDMITRI
jgi:hypothetical protein